MQPGSESFRYPNDQERRLAKYLAALAEDGDERYRTARKRQTLAGLRLGLATADGWHPAVAQVVDSLFVSGTVGPATEGALYQGAALFGSHPSVEGAKPRNESLGRALRNLMSVRASSRERNVADERESFDGHFEALLNAHRDELFMHLRRTIARFQGTEVGIDWAQLMCDIRNWDDDKHHVQRQWARDWWSAEQASLNAASFADQITSQEADTTEAIDEEGALE